MPFVTNLKELGTDFGNYFVDCSTNQTCNGIKTFANGLIVGSSSTIGSSFGSSSVIGPIVSNNTPFTTNIKLKGTTDIGTIFTDLSSNQTCYGIKTFQNGVSTSQVQLSSPFGTAVSTPSYTTTSSYYPTYLKVKQNGNGIGTTLTDLGKLFLDLSTNQTTYGATSFPSGLYTLQYISLNPFVYTVFGITVQGGTRNVDYTVSSVNGYYVLYMYNSANSGQKTMQVSFSQKFSANVLLVAGGGGGGVATGPLGGGGGAGGVGTGTLFFQRNVIYTAVVGSGGALGYANEFGGSIKNGGNGLFSSLSDSASVINEKATGGGGGQTPISTGAYGGDAGDSGTGNSSSTGSSQLAYNPVFIGYNVSDYSNTYGGSYGGGGGGAGGIGSCAFTGVPAAQTVGGPGVVWSIDNQTYGRGGDGGYSVYSAPLGPATNSGSGSIGGCATALASNANGYPYLSGNPIYPPYNGAAGTIAIAFQTLLQVVW